MPKSSHAGSVLDSNYGSLIYWGGSWAGYLMSWPQFPTCKMQNKMVSLLYWADKFTHTHKELHEVVSISTSCCYDNTSSVHPGRRTRGPMLCTHTALPDMDFSPNCEGCPSPKLQYSKVSLRCGGWASGILRRNFGDRFKSPVSWHSYI